MFPLLVDVFVCVLAYLTLVVLYSALLKTKTHSLFIRGVCILLSYVVAVTLIDYFVNIGLMIYDLFTGGNPYAALFLFFIILITGFTMKQYFKRPEKIDTVEMENFIAASLRFANYIRRTDADTAAAIDSYKVRKTYKDINKRAPTDEITATAYDLHVTKFKKVSIKDLRKTKKYIPPDTRENIARLNRNMMTDVSPSFHFELMKKEDIPHLEFMNQFVIDPVQRTLSCTITFPHDKPVKVSTETERASHIQQVYDMLHILIAEEWFSFYSKYISSISVETRCLEFGTSMEEKIRKVMSMGVLLDDLVKRSETITSVHTIGRFATINFYE